MTSFSVFGMLSLVHSVLSWRIFEEVEKKQICYNLIEPFQLLWSALHKHTHYCFCQFCLNLYVPSIKLLVSSSLVYYTFPVILWYRNSESCRFLWMTLLILLYPWLKFFNHCKWIDISLVGFQDFNLGRILLWNINIV